MLEILIGQSSKGVIKFSLIDTAGLKIRFEKWGNMIFMSYWIVVRFFW
jgi:hypothetical protein